MLGSAGRLVLALAALLGATVPALAHDRGFDIAVLSSRPDTVTGDDALIRVDVPGDVPLGKVRVLLNGADVTGDLKPSRRDHSLTGLITGLREGVNHLKVHGPGRHHHHGHRPAAELVLTNYPITGPVFSGPHEQPFICETQFFQLPDATNLGPALDANCSIATRVDYFYRTTGNAWSRLTDLTTHPADLASTTTNEGKTVPFIIRMETGTANRSIYQTTILHDPANEKDPGFARKPKGWNGRLIFTFGGGCINGWYRQGRTTGGVTDINMLGLGYAVASSSLNVFGNNCNELLAAESMMMAKEKFIEAYGPPRWTFGFGCSGGSYQQHQIGDNYPGLLQGIIPGCSFPEVGFATIYMITDAWLLDNYFNNVAPGLFAPEQQRAVTGFLVLNTMPNVAVGARRIDPRVFCGVVPAADRYHPVTNPTGVRCDVYDHTVNVYGRDPATGFARRPLDNVGVQYGLKALNDKVISVDQFLALNEKIGGFDQDANIVAKRSVADPDALRAAYRSGRLTNGGLGLGELPIIDYRAYNDDAVNGDIHVRYHSFSMRGRIKEANGHAKNHVMLVEDSRYGLYSTASPLLRFAIAKMDEWIGNIEADRSHRSKAEKVVRAKPEDLQDGCNTRDPNPTFIVEKQVLRKGQCEQLYPSAPPPREVAGAPNEADIIKCRLKRIDWDDYKVSFSDAQKAKLRSIFPDGVCDYSKRGVGQRAPAGTWQFF